jgi:hypothetical protein
MSVRTTATEVKELIETSLSDTIIERFIVSANRIVSKILGNDTTLDEDDLSDIECWLSAHFVASTRELQAKSEGADGASISYQGQTAMGLDATLYGQQVKILDTTGKLAASLGKQAVEIYAIPGRTYDELYNS